MVKSATNEKIPLDPSLSSAASMPFGKDRKLSPKERFRGNLGSWMCDTLGIQEKFEADLIRVMASANTHSMKPEYQQILREVIKFRGWI